jgi:hypothetical protein
MYDQEFASKMSCHSLHVPLDCGIYDNRAHHPAGFCHSDHHHGGCVWMKSMCCLQVMVSEYPRGEPLFQAD